jgi:putative tryptophan/tyrosine transport system substrate-binding protein
MASDLVGRKVAVILSGGGPAAIETAMAATRTIPIVFTTGVDPVAAGLVASLNRPGGNVTGVTLFPTELGPKRLELLRELIPTADRIALIVNPHNQAVARQDVVAVQEAARRLALALVVLEAANENEVERAFAAAVAQRTAAVLVGADAIFLSMREHIAALGVRLAIPTVTAMREGVAAGGLMSYGSSFPDGYRQAGVYVGRILKGEKPADLPVVQPAKFELVINLKTAKSIGLAIPESFLLRADEVIE